MKVASDSGLGGGFCRVLQCAHHLQLVSHAIQYGGKSDNKRNLKAYICLHSLLNFKKIKRKIHTYIYV